MTVRRVTPTKPKKPPTITTPPRRVTGTRVPIGGGDNHKFPTQTHVPPPTITPPAVDPTPPDVTGMASILDQPIPMVFGARRVQGMLGAYRYNSTTKIATFGVVFGYGEQDSISTSTTYFNGEVITAVTGIASEAVHVGDGSTALSAALTGLTGWTAADTTLWKNYAHAVFTVDCRVVRSPSNPKIETDLGGMLIDASWRSGGSASTASVNPIEIAHELNTNASYRGVSSTRIDDDSWEAVANWCDEVMSDTSARYEYNGIVTNRDTAGGVADVLSLALAYEYIGDDGLIHLWCEMAPPPITGEWSATASATITEDSTAGEATTELTAGDRVYVGTDFRTVASVTDDDTVVLDSALTVSGVRVRQISPVDLDKHHWAEPTSAHEASKLSTPDKYRVRFSDGENRGSHEVLSSYGAGTDKIVERHLDGCTSATVAARHAETTLKVEWLQPWYWQGTVWQDIGAQLDIGDVITFDDDVLTQQAARVIPPLVARPDGTYVVNLREYDPSAYSDSTDTTDTPPALGTAWSSATPPIISWFSSVYSGTEYDAFYVDGSGRQVYGDDDTGSTVAGSRVRIPYNTWLYVLNSGGTEVGLARLNSSDEFEFGDGSYPAYFNGTSFILDNDVPIKGGHAVAAQMLEYTTAGAVEVGGATKTILQGTQVEIDCSTSPGAIALTGVPKFKGIGSGAADPTTSNFGSSEWGVWKNTANGNIYFVYNDGGTIYKGQLT